MTTQPPSPSSNGDTAPRLRAHDTSRVPRGGWTYTVEETGVTINASTITRLKYLVHAHMSVNELRIPPDLGEIVEDCACRAMASPEKWCAERRDPVEYGDLKRSGWSASDVRRFVKSIYQWGTKSGFSFVEQAEAERRASICATCPLNKHVSGCLGCAGVLGLVRSVRGSRSTSLDDKLEVCEVCGCELKVKVLLPGDAIDNTGLEYPEHCWQRELVSPPIV